MSLAEAFTMLFDKGGAVMVVLFTLSIYSGGVILMKMWQFWQGRVMKFAVTEEVLALVRGGDVARARERARQINSPLSRVLLAVIDTIQDSTLSPAKRQAEIQRVGNEEIMQLESHMKGLDMAANVAPLLGLLG